MRPSQITILAALAVLVTTTMSAAQDRGFRVERNRTETKTISIGATGVLDLDNFGGDITVTAGSGRDVVVQIVRVSRGRTDADAEAGLDRVIVDIEQRGNRATIKMRYPEQDRQSPFRVRASYNVTAPSATAVNIKSLGGSIRVKGIHGDLSANTAGGNIEIGGAGRVSQAKTLGGNVTLQEIKARRLTGSSTGGEVIARDITAENVELSSLGGSVEFSGALVRSGRYDLHTTGGNVRFIPSGPVGFELDASTFGGQVQSELPLQTVGATSGRGPGRTLRGTFGDGSALVKATTMSGNVVIGKK